MGEYMTKDYKALLHNATMVLSIIMLAAIVANVSLTFIAPGWTIRLISIAGVLFCMVACWLLYTAISHFVNDRDQIVVIKWISSLNAQIQAERNKLNKTTTNAFTTAQTQYNNYNSQINIAQRNLANATNAIDSARYTSEINRLKDLRRPYWRTMDNEKKAWNDRINKKIKELEGNVLLQKKRSLRIQLSMQGSLNDWLAIEKHATL